MKNVITTFCLIIISLNLQAQNVSYEWAHAIGGTGLELGTDITTDAQGNVYTVGLFNNTTIDMDPSPATLNFTNVAAQDIFISKNDPNGNLIWGKHLGGLGPDIGNSIVVDQNNNVYICGDFGQTLDMDPGAGVYNLTANAPKNSFILKLDANGNFVWAKLISSHSINYAKEISIHNGHLFITGQFRDTADFDPGLNVNNLVSTYNTSQNNYWSDAYVLKLDTNGNYIWAKSFGGEEDELVYSITNDQQGNVLVGGSFKGSADFDPSALVHNINGPSHYTAFINKLDSNGNHIWTAAFQGTNRSEVFGVTTDAYNNVYATGGHEALTDFDPGNTIYNLNSNGGPLDIFIVKLNSNGSFNWAHTLGAANQDLGNKIKVDDENNLYIGGVFSSSSGGVDFDPGNSIYPLQSFGPNTDCFILKLTDAGNFILAKHFRGGNGDNLTSLAIDAQKNIFSTGAFWQITDFDPNIGQAQITSLGVYDAFICKLSQCNINDSSLIINTCNTSFTYNGTNYTSSGLYTHVFTNAQNCDSIVHLLLNFGQASSATISQTSCDSFTWFGNTYTSSGNYSHTFPNGNAAGCDSTINLNLTINNSSSTTITQTACDSFNWFGNTYTSSGNYSHTIPNGNAAGCDSTINLNLTINNSSSASLTQTACDSFNWFGNTYNASGIYTHTLVGGNVNGCDSIITLNLTVNNSTTSSQTISSCDAFYSWYGNIYTSSGSYYHTLSNSNTSGCDSILNLNLNLQPIDTTISILGNTLNSNQSNATSYQWIDCENYSLIPGATAQNYTPTLNGSFAVIITNGNCIDTSLCKNFSSVGIADQAAQQIKIYPSPFQNQVCIEFAQTQKQCSIQLYNLLGNKVFSETYRGTKKYFIPFDYLASGVYFIEIHTDRDIFRNKIIKE